MTSISQERLLYQRVGFTHRLRSQWGARFKLRNSAGVLVDGYTIARAVDEPAVYQFIHITTTNPDSYPSDDEHACAVEDIGISRFPNTGISYNELVMPGGHLFEAQPMGRRGAHTVNDDQRATCGTSGCPSIGTGLSAPSFNLNVVARALALARDVDDPVTDADVDAAARWCAAGRLAGMVRKDAHIHGHRCVSTKSCPGDRAWTRMDDIRDRTADYLRQGDVDVALTQAEHDALIEVRDRLAKWESVPNDASDEPDDNITYQARAQRNYGRINETAVGMRKLLAIPPGSLVVSDLTDAALAKIAKAVNDEQARRVAKGATP